MRIAIDAVAPPRFERWTLRATLEICGDPLRRASPLGSFGGRSAPPAEKTTGPGSCSRPHERAREGHALDHPRG
jgi:hypothetical protein